MDKKYDKIETNNPLLDELVFAAKQFIGSTLLKSEDEANKYETEESRRNFVIYNRIILGLDTSYYYKYGVDDILNASPNLDVDTAISYSNNFDSIPKQLQDKLVKYKNDQFMKDHTTHDGRFIDMNKYYRDLSGIPENITEYVYLTEEQYNSLNIVFDYETTPIHELNGTIREAIYESPIMQDIINANPTKNYLNYISKNLSAYTIRKMHNHGLIYMDTSNIDDSVSNKYRVFIERNRLYVMSNFNNGAVRRYSDYYDNFISMMIIIQSVIDLINELPSYYITKDFFDLRTIENYLKSQGVEPFKDIPLKYQQRIVQALNGLIRNKATDQAFIDILSIFNIDNINIYKYYLCKQHNIDIDGEYVNSGDIEQDYSLKFLKVNVNSSVKSAARDTGNYDDYDSITGSDESWNGPYDSHTMKLMHLKKDFNMELSKYISIEALYSVTDATFQMGYFLNILKFSKVSATSIPITLNSLSSTRTFNLVNVIYYITALTNHYHDAEDKIIYNQSDCLCFRGFNFDANMKEIADYLNKKGYTLDDFGISGFKIPNGPLSIKDVIRIYIDNSEIYNHLMYMIETTGNEKINRIYQELFDALMVTKLNFEHFYIDELGRNATTFTEYLEYNDKFLYEKIKAFEDIIDGESRRNAIGDELASLSNEILDILDTPQLNQIFVNLPSDAGNYAKKYILELLDIFKAYTIHILDFKNVYTLDKENKVNITDWLYTTNYYHKCEQMFIRDELHRWDMYPKEDSYKITDDLRRYAEYKPKDKCNIDDDIYRTTNFYNKNDDVVIKDILKIYRWFYRRNNNDTYIMNDYVDRKYHTFVKSDSVSIWDDCDISHFYREQE